MWKVRSVPEGESVRLFFALVILGSTAFAERSRVCEVYPSKISVAGSTFEKIEITPLAWEKGPAYDIQNNRIYFDVNKRKWCVAEISKLENFDCEKNTIDLNDNGKLVGQIQINRESRFFEVVSIGKNGKPDIVNPAKVRAYIEMTNQKIRTDVTIGLQSFRAGKPTGQYSAFRSWQYDYNGNLKLERLNSRQENRGIVALQIVGNDLTAHACGKTALKRFNSRDGDRPQYGTPSPLDRQQR
jgi:hypothetical protein